MKTYITTARMGITSISLAAVLAGTTASADQVILDDLIVDGSACIGFDCVNGESFGFDTLRLKENNLRIRAVDTSTTASFPGNDWQITFNDSSNGGANKFSIDDIDGGRTPFTIEAGAPSHSLYVEDGGRIGFGTATPVVSLHVKDGNTPTLRLEQDGSSGFTPQTWDMAGNEANFFIRDATNGSSLPFRLFPGAPSNALTIEASGDIGVGTTSPTTSLHVLRSSGTAKILIQDTNATTTTRNQLALINNGGNSITMENSNTSLKWRVFHDTGSDFKLASSFDANDELVLTTAGDLTIHGQLVTGGGTCGGGCDRVFDTSYKMPSLTEHSAEMFAKGYLPNVGPTVENEPINVSDKLGRMLNELEHAHIFISQLSERIATLETQLDQK